MCSAGKYAKLHLEELTINFGLRVKEFKFLCSILVYWEGVDLKAAVVVVKVYDGVCRSEGFGLLLAKSCESLAALTPCKQKHPLKLSAIYQWDSCFMLEANQAGFGDNF
jgi:hypothetical protein